VSKDNLMVLVVALVTVAMLAAAYVLVTGAVVENPGREAPAGLLH
jgi:hypothetical protein